MNIDKEYVVLKVAANSRHKSVAGSITKNIEEGHKVALTFMGAGACQQAIKACIDARRFLSTKAKTVTILPAYHTVEIEDKYKDGEIKEMTLIIFYLQVANG